MAIFVNAGYSPANSFTEFFMLGSHTLLPFCEGRCTSTTYSVVNGLLAYLLEITDMGEKIY